MFMHRLLDNAIYPFRLPPGLRDATTLRFFAPQLTWMVTVPQRDQRALDLVHPNFAQAARITSGFLLSQAPLCFLSS
jgi:hypothetical protein